MPTVTVRPSSEDQYQQGVACNWYYEKKYWYILSARVYVHTHIIMKAYLIYLSAFRLFISPLINEPSTIDIYSRAHCYNFCETTVLPTVQVFNSQLFYLQVFNSQLFCLQVFNSQLFYLQLFNSQLFYLQVFNSQLFYLQVINSQLFYLQVFNSQLFYLQIINSQLFYLQY
jgi:hypothetical protein